MVVQKKHDITKANKTFKNNQSFFFIGEFIIPIPSQLLLVEPGGLIYVHKISIWGASGESNSREILTCTAPGAKPIWSIHLCDLDKGRDRQFKFVLYLFLLKKKSLIFYESNLDQRWTYQVRCANCAGKNFSKLPHSRHPFCLMAEIMTTGPKPRWRSQVDQSLGVGFQT